MVILILWFILAYMQINIKKLTFSLTGFVVLLLLIHLGLYLLDIYVFPGQTWLEHLIYRFDLDSEPSVPTWFSVILLFIASLAAFFVGISEKNKAFSKYWYFIASILLIFSIDEAASFHESFGLWLGQRLGVEIPLGFATIRDWVVIALIAVILVTIILWNFVRKLPKRTMWLLIAAAAVFVSGSLGVETLHFTAFSFEDASFAHRLSNAAEEGLEMLGAVLALYALLDYARRYTKPLKIDFTE